MTKLRQKHRKAHLKKSSISSTLQSDGRLPRNTRHDPGILQTETGVNVKKLKHNIFFQIFFQYINNNFIFSRKIAHKIGERFGRFVG
jgi:hypothetical protein